MRLRVSQFVLVSVLFIIRDTCMSVSELEIYKKALEKSNMFEFNNSTRNLTKRPKRYLYTPRRKGQSPSRVFPVNEMLANSIEDEKDERKDNLKQLKKLLVAGHQRIQNKLNHRMPNKTRWQHDRVEKKLDLRVPSYAPSSWQHERIEKKLNPRVPSYAQREWQHDRIEKKIDLRVPSYTQTEWQNNRIEKKLDPRRPSYTQTAWQNDRIEEQLDPRRPSYTQTAWQNDRIEEQLDPRMPLYAQTAWQHHRNEHNLETRMPSYEQTAWQPRVPGRDLGQEATRNYDLNNFPYNYNSKFDGNRNVLKGLFHNILKDKKTPYPHYRYPDIPHKHHLHYPHYIWPMHPTQSYYASDGRYPQNGPGNGSPPVPPFYPPEHGGHQNLGELGEMPSNALKDNENIISEGATALDVLFHNLDDNTAILLREFLERAKEDMSHEAYESLISRILAKYNDLHTEYQLPEPRRPVDKLD